MVSVIVCTYNRAQYIGKCLEHLALQTAQLGDYEVVIVNNNSTDNSEEIIQTVLKTHPTTPFRYYVEMNQGHTYARNRGIEEGIVKKVFDRSGKKTQSGLI